MVLRTILGGVPPAEATSTTVGLQEIVQFHPILWKGIWSASRVCLCHRTNRLVYPSCGEVPPSRSSRVFILYFVAWGNERCPEPCSSSAFMRHGLCEPHIWVKKQARTRTETDNAMVPPRVRTRCDKAEVDFPVRYSDSQQPAAKPERRCAA